MLMVVGGQAAGVSVPTASQVAMMNRGLAQFMHFSVDPWSSIEHNCVGSSNNCIPASKFNPTNLSTDQWVETAVAFGAEEICLTAHHEGGFCLWDTKFSNYSVMHSPYGKDVVAQFVASCNKYGVKPCYYMGPNANGYLSNELKLSADEFVRRQLGMLTELLTNYGTDYVSRLWWDHYPGGCGGLAPCPDGSFPAAWPEFVDLVRKLSPSTIICPGPDCDGHQGESGLGKYPAWFPCTPTEGNGTELTCGGHTPNASLPGFHPYEACATMHNGWFCKGDGSTRGNTYWSPGTIWDHYMNSVGIGWVNTLNAPPGTTGQIPQPLVDNMVAFGAARKQLLTPIATATANTTIVCGNSTAAGAGLELDVGAPVTFNAVMTREDLTGGQRIASYAVDYWDATKESWVSFPTCKSGACVPGAPPPSGQRIPAVPQGQCGTPMLGINLVNDAPPSTHDVGVTSQASDCQAKCLASPPCNFWTWHDFTNVPQYKGHCFLRDDAVYDYHPESKHVSGVCNHTLTPDGAADGPGIHGASVGARLIDFVGTTTVSKVRFRCTAALTPDSTAVISSFSLHKGQRPPK